jgi:pimeloyl-ACP methyl ester carboxylesterase
MLVENGYAVAVFHTSDVEPDRADANGGGIRAACDRVFSDSRDRSDHWGCLTAWSWGASRVTDFLTADNSFDPSRITVIGHSRGGKTALWAAAQDTRFAVAISNESGCGGAALSRRTYGETVARITTAFPYWFAPSFAGFAKRENELPIDQHQLIGLIAPRGVCIGSANEDLWADPRGEFLALASAAPVYKLLGKQSIAENQMPAMGEHLVTGPTSYHVRPGAHDLTEGDWGRYMKFLKQRFEAK